MSDPGIFEAWARDLPIGFNGPRNQALWRAMAKVVGDNSLADAQAMVAESLPQFASAEANGHTANDRGLVKGPTEGAAAFAARLVAYRDQWSLAGTPVGLLIQLHFAGFEGAVLVQQNGVAHQLASDPVLAEVAAFVAAWRAQKPSEFPSWYGRTILDPRNGLIPASTDGKPAIPPLTVPWWTFDGGMDAAGNQWCSRFGVLFPVDAPDPGLGTATNLSSIRRIVAAWKPDTRLCLGFWVCSAGKFVGWPPRAVDDGADVGPSTVTHYTAE